jgi:hypothetical protein
MKMADRFMSATTAATFATCSLLFGPTVFAQPASDSLGELLVGKTAFGDWRADAPLVRRKITELPPPYATRSASNPPRVIAKPISAAPKVPPGFQVELFVSNLRDPRTVRVAPNGDIFIAESEPGRIRVLRAARSLAFTNAQRAIRVVHIRLMANRRYKPSSHTPHDIGYVRGVVKGDKDGGYVVDGTGRKISLPRGSSDAALAPYHVERSKLFVLDRVAAVEELDSARIAQRNGFESRTVRFFGLRLGSIAQSRLRDIAPSSLRLSQVRPGCIDARCAPCS